MIIRVVTTHWKSPRWAKLQHDYFTRNTRNEFRIYCFYGPQSGEPFEDYFFAQPGPLEQGPNECEERKMNMLADIVMAEPDISDDDVFVFVHGDTLPLPGWEKLMDHLSMNQVVAIQRLENNGEKIPHSSFCMAKVGVWKEIGGTWDRGTWLDADGNPVNDVGGGLLHQLEQQGVPWMPLNRRNVANLHNLFFGVYGDGQTNAIYHHAMGLRDVANNVLGGQISRFERARPERARLQAKPLSRLLNLLFKKHVKIAMRRRDGEATTLSRLMEKIHPTVQWESKIVANHSRMSEQVYEVIRTRSLFFEKYAYILSEIDLNGNREGRTGF